MTNKTTSSTPRSYLRRRASILAGVSGVLIFSGCAPTETKPINLQCKLIAQHSNDPYYERVSVFEELGIAQLVMHFGPKMKIDDITITGVVNLSDTKIEIFFPSDDKHKNCNLNIDRFTGEANRECWENGGGPGSEKNYISPMICNSMNKKKF